MQVEKYNKGCILITVTDKQQNKIDLTVIPSNNLHKNWASTECSQRFDWQSRYKI